MGVFHRILLAASLLLPPDYFKISAYGAVLYATYLVEKVYAHHHGIIKLG